MKIPFAYRGLVLALLLAALLPWAAAHFALRPAYAAWRDCRRMQARLAILVPRTAEPVAWDAGSPEVVLSGALLDTLRRAAATFPVQVAAYEPALTMQQDGWAVHTARVTLGGSYADLLRVVQALERSLPHCRMRTLEWRTTTEPRTRQVRLTLTFYMQQILRNK